MGQSRAQGARSLGPILRAARGVGGGRQVPLWLRAHPCRQAFPDGRASWAERVLGNDPSVHRSWMWRVSPSFGPGCHPLSEGRVPVLWPPAQGPRCLRGVIAVGSEVQGGGLSSLMSEWADKWQEMALRREAVSRSGRQSSGRHSIACPPSEQTAPLRQKH